MSWRRALEASVIFALVLLVITVLGGALILAGLGAAAVSRILIPFGALLMVLGYLIILLGGIAVFFKVLTDLVGEEVETRLAPRLALMRQELQSLSKLAEQRGETKS